MWALTAIERRLASKAFGSALFLTVGGVFLVVGILDLRETQRLQAEGELARGKVIGRHWSARGRPYSLDVELQTRADVRVTLAESVGRGRYERTKPGDTVPLHYLPSDPSVMKIGAKPQPDPVWFVMSLGLFIAAGGYYLVGKRREALQSVQIAPSDLDEQHGAQAQQRTLRAQRWLARLRGRELNEMPEGREPMRPRQKLILMLVAAGAGIALPFFLIPRLPPRGRHEYLLEGQVLSIALDRKEASIKHDAINGFRPATTMSYNVPDAGELADLKPGELITATLVVVRDDIHLDDIKKVVAARERPPAPANDLYLVAVGDVPPALMSSLVAGAEQTLGIQVAVLRSLSVDRTLYDPARSQLIADELIAAVRSQYPTLARNPRARVIAITAQDMYIKARRETWRYAFSRRSNENSVAVVSYARMDPAYPAYPTYPAYLGNTPEEELLRSRLRKMVIKNIGIMYYGLPVSRDPRSVLYGNVLGPDDLDYMSEFFEPRQ